MNSLQAHRAGLDPLILSIRGQKVILDADLAALYGVPTKRLNEQVKRNAERFPSDFVFQLSSEEKGLMWSQIATTSPVSSSPRPAPTPSPSTGP